MKIWYPLEYDEIKYKNISAYILACQIQLYTLKSILKRNIIYSKWEALKEPLTEIGVIDEKTFIRRYKPVDIAYQFVNNLKCYYDVNITKCYYAVQDSVRCVGTNVSLNKVIKLLEYGNKYIPPINWVRHSYIIFKDNILEGVK